MKQIWMLVLYSLLVLSCEKDTNSSPKPFNKEFFSTIQVTTDSVMLYRYYNRYTDSSLHISDTSICHVLPRISFSNNESIAFEETLDTLKLLAML